MDGRGLLLLLGQGRWETRLPWAALEGAADTAMLSGYLKQYVNRETANWVAVVLAKARVIDLDRSRPVKAHLRPCLIATTRHRVCGALCSAQR